MMLYHVVAMADGRVIGKDNKLPWHFSSDLKHFKKLTSGSTVIMGRKTFESIGKLLPNRQNFVLSKSGWRKTTAAAAEVLYGGLRIFDSVDSAIKSVTTPDAYIIGGAEIFNQTMDRIDGIYLTRIYARFDGDTFYPELPAHFKEKSREKLQDNPAIEVIYYENTNRK